MRSGFVSAETGPLPPWTDYCRRETVWRQSLSVTPLRCTLIDCIDYVMRPIHCLGSKRKCTRPSSRISRTGPNRPHTPGLKLVRLIRIGLFESLRLFVRVNPLLERVIDSFYSPSDIARESINRLGEPRM